MTRTDENRLNRQGSIFWKGIDKVCNNSQSVHKWLTMTEANKNGQKGRGCQFRTETDRVRDICQSAHR